MGVWSVLERVAGEREKQDTKWGVQYHTPAEWMSILGEEFGEACVEVNETFQWGPGGLSQEQYIQELIQVAAVAVAAIENMERRYGPKLTTND